MKIEKIPHISEVIGTWGRWQQNIFFFCMSTSVFSAFHNLGLTLMAPTVDFQCVPSATSSFDNKTDKCLQHKEGYDSCVEFEYDKSFFQDTVVSEWDLVCDRAWMVSTTQSFYMVGMILSSLVCGQMSDKYGRLPILWASILFEIFAGISCALSFSIYQYMISRLILGIGAYGRYLTGFMLVLETTGTKHRSKMGILCRFGWALGYFILPGIVWICRDFRSTQWACSLSEVVFLLWLWKIPESPRWQLVNGSIDKADKELRRAAEVNNIPLIGIEEKLKELKEHFEQEQKNQKGKHKPNFLDLWKTSKLRQNTLILCLTWFTTGFVYYGLSLNIGDFGGDLLVNFAIAGLLEFPSFALSLYIMEIFDRRTVQVLIMFGAGVGSLIAVPFYFFFEGTSTFIVILIMVVKFCVSLSYYTIYIFSAEIYPTSIRQVGVGSNSVASRVGSIVAPFVRELSLHTHPSVTLITFFLLSTANTISIFFLPETKNTEIPDTIDEAEEFSVETTKTRRLSIASLG
ncbi:organic cation transporter protein-like protein [Leptotrombidium deliense]|uniref:Organic cation transporter protein-like protein n=1 Tax=Leptotrombidium deliense TaxID=299467 RepID=A0A443SNL2_9ACAR|nr:organic cation transporter protein-like protein [Leptotrombidium deliense]